MVERLGMRDPAIPAAGSDAGSDAGQQTAHSSPTTMLSLVSALRPSIQFGGRHISTSSSCWARNIRRRVTRLTTDYAVYAEELEENVEGANDKHQLQLVNRNPRNLEQLSLEPKPFGFELETPSRCYWNKVTFTKQGKYLEAKIVHHSGRTVVSASTREASYQDHGLPVTDTSAAINVATILARRCLESGVLFAHAETDDSDKSEKAKAFFNQLRSEGLKLKENDFIFPRRKRDL